MLEKTLKPWLLNGLCCLHTYFSTRTLLNLREVNGFLDEFQIPFQLGLSKPDLRKMLKASLTGVILSTFLYIYLVFVWTFNFLLYIVVLFLPCYRLIRISLWCTRDCKSTWPRKSFCRLYGTSARWVESICFQIWII